MTKFTKLIDLSTGNGSNTNGNQTKGTQTNPYTQEEHDAFASGTWPGGYVEGVGFVVPDRSKTALDSSYPDTGNVLYPGIYVSAGIFHALDDDIGHSILATLDVWWDSGYTGNLNCFGDPNWIHSNISAEIKSCINTDGSACNHVLQAPVIAHWHKIRDNEYSVRINAIISLYNGDDYIGNDNAEIEYSLEELQQGYNN